MSTIVRTNGLLSLTPTADHTGKEGYFVEYSSGSAAICNAATDLPIGVITDGQTTSGKSSVALNRGFGGTVRVKVTTSSPGTINAGTKLQLKSDGTVQADGATGARVLVAIALEDGAAGELIEAVLIEPIKYGAAVTDSTTNGAASGAADLAALKTETEAIGDTLRALLASLSTSGYLA